jgi:IS4 transposase
MFRISRIQELLQPISRDHLDRLATQHQSDKHAKRFKSWDQLTAMVYAQASGSKSLRTLEKGFNAQRTHHYHLGTGELRRSTLAEANERRSPKVFADVVRSLMEHAGRRERGECKDLLYLLDSTSITLKGRGFDQWTHSNRTRNTQGVKLHLLLNEPGKAPQWHSITAPNVNDCTEALELPLEAGATYVFDKGYCNYNWWARIQAHQARFVTRFKSNAALTVLSTQEISREDSLNILNDQVVRFTYTHPSGGRRNRYTTQLRRIEVAREGNAPLVLATNDLQAPASEIAQLYKQRWQVELFFKWVKQHLNIGSFLGRSANAVKTQILTALITYLLLLLYHRKHQRTDSLWLMLSELRATFFQRPTVEAAAHERRRQQRAAFAALQPGLFG